MEGLSTLFDSKILGDLKKPQLVEIILELQKEKNSLKLQSNNIGEISDRSTDLERSHFLYLQYGRRSSIEISGIPPEVEQNDLEKHVIKIFREAKVEVQGKYLDHHDIEACYRIGKKSGNYSFRQSEFCTRRSAQRQKSERDQFIWKTIHLYKR